MTLSKRNISILENELADGNVCVVRRRGKRVIVRRLPQHKYPSNTKSIRIKKDVWEKVKARAEHDGATMAVALGDMLLEAYRRRLLQQLRNLQSKIIQ